MQQAVRSLEQLGSSAWLLCHLTHTSYVTGFHMPLCPGSGPLCPGSMPSLPTFSYVLSKDPHLTSAQRRYGMLVMSASTVFATTPPLLSFLASNTHSTASTGLAVALNVMFGGGPGLLVGVWIYKPQDAKGGYRSANWINGAFMLAIVAICIGLRLWYGWANRSRDLKRKFVM